MEADVERGTPLRQMLPRTAPWDRQALKDPGAANRFANAFEESMRQQRSVGATCNVNQLNGRATAAFSDAAEKHPPRLSSSKRRPWISDSTMLLVSQRLEARHAQNDAEERRLNKCVKRAARRDRKAWLSNLASTGDWSSLRKLKKGVAHGQGRLAHADGAVVSSEARADTFALYLDDSQ